MKLLVPAPSRAVTYRSGGPNSRNLPKLSDLERFRFPGKGLRFWTVTRACAGHGDPERVKAWLLRAQAVEFKVGVRVANSLLHAYAKVGMNNWHVTSCWI